RVCWFVIKLILNELVCLVPAEDIIQESGIKKARVGENVTLQCSCQDDAITFFFWYQQTLGGKPQMISNRMMHKQDAEITSDFMKRFEVHGTGRDNNLTITNLQLSDSATYFCGVLLFSAVEFGDGVFLHVQASLTPLQAVVKQQTQKHFQDGDLIDLSCTIYAQPCAEDQDQSFYWFRHSASQPAIVYPSTGQCAKLSDDSSVKNCTLSLRVESASSSDTGTYYCALASCGEIIFGNGTRVEISALSLKRENAQNSQILVVFLSVALVFTSTLVVLLGYSVYTMTNRRKCKCTEYCSNCTFRVVHLCFYLCIYLHFIVKE
uniref:Ig-like domain-containing protein n=1 Tax=Sphaeramia orbicularis TaxID=375764 RepID=A0A673CGX2_9TELE